VFDFLYSFYLKPFSFLEELKKNIKRPSETCNYSVSLKFCYSPTDAQDNCFKKISKFTLKQLRHVSV